MWVYVGMHVHARVTGRLGDKRVHTEAKARQVAVSAKPGAELREPGPLHGYAHQPFKSSQAKHDANK